MLTAEQEVMRPLLRIQEFKNTENRHSLRTIVLSNLLQQNHTKFTLLCSSGSYEAVRYVTCKFDKGNPLS